MRGVRDDTHVPGNLIGTPTLEGTYTFPLQATGGTGATDTETFAVTVTAPRPLTITTPSAQPADTVKQSYCCVRLSVDGGVPGYAWRLRAGTLGNQLTRSP